MRALRLLSVFTGFLLLGTAALFAQDGSERFVQERLVANQKLRDFERYQALKPRPQAIVAESKKVLFDAGGWVDVAYTEFHNDDNDNDLVDAFDADLSVDTRLWVELRFRPSLEGETIYEHKIYARFRNFYVTRWPDHSTVAKDDNDGPHTEMLYVDLDLKYANLVIGRQYLTLGRGITYGNVHDGISMNTKYGAWDLLGFVTKTLPHEENIDFSVPGFDKDSERYFVGAQAVWQPKESVALYAYFLTQTDESDPFPASGQAYDYHSQYWGLGGYFSHPKGVTGWAEYILESGKSVVFHTDDRAPVRAQAVNFGARYQAKILTKPSLTLEYAFGTGDADRTSVTNTVGGNLRGQDHNFLSFGYFPSGYALAPTLSNIHIFRVGGSFQPFERFQALERVTVGSDFYAFWKHRKGGGIYDVDALAFNHEVGQELDLNIQWPVLSDVILAARTGIFFPGNAFVAPNDEPEVYVHTNFTFTF